MEVDSNADPVAKALDFSGMEATPAEAPQVPEATQPAATPQPTKPAEAPQVKPAETPQPAKPAEEPQVKPAETPQPAKPAEEPQVAQPAGPPQVQPPETTPAPAPAEPLQAKLVSPGAEDLLRIALKKIEELESKIIAAPAATATNALKTPPTKRVLPSPSTTDSSKGAGLTDESTAPEDEDMAEETQPDEEDAGDVIVMPSGNKAT